MERLTRGGVALAYAEAGTGAPPLLLVHCWCGDHTHLTPQFEYFGRTHRVVAVDLRGHGASDKPVSAVTALARMLNPNRPGLSDPAGSPWVRVEGVRV